MKENIIFTFDYELFLGYSSGSVEECLIYPTKELINIFKKRNVRAIFFVDTLFLIRLKEQSFISNKAKIDFQLILDQLNDIAKQHDIYLHLHPHWLDAVYHEENGIWDLSNHCRYTFEEFTSSEVYEMFSQSLEILREVLSNPNYVSLGYRAGGWSIQPFSKFKEAFIAFGVKVDYSVIPGKMFHSTAQKFDFLTAPTNKRIYNFSECPSIEDNEGKFKEIPISVYSISPLLYFLRKNYLHIQYMLLKYFKKPKGSTVKAKILNEKSTYSKYTFIAQIENLDIFQLFGLYYKFKKDKYIHFVSHPKLMTGFDFFSLKFILRHAKKR